MELALMIEGQNGIDWETWRKIASVAEEEGFVGLFRSDHFTNSRPPDKDSLELWVSLAYLAAETERIEFGPLVTPMSFRHPVHTARIAKDVDALSGGRLVLGLGAGWQEREHEMFGFPLLDVGARMDRFEEGVEVVYRLLRTEGRVDFDGEYYQLREAALLPPLPNRERPPISIGGTGWNRTMPLAARFADDWNAIMVNPEEFEKFDSRLTELLEQEGRDPGSVRRSLMTSVLFGRDQDELEDKAAERGRSLDELRGGSAIVGTPQEVIDRIGEYADAGLDRIMLQWLDTDDLDRLRALAEAVIPAFHRD